MSTESLAGPNDETQGALCKPPHHGQRAHRNTSYPWLTVRQAQWVSMTGAWAAVFVWDCSYLSPHQRKGPRLLGSKGSAHAVGPH